MIENFTLALKAGGFSRCTKDWNRWTGGPLDQCFKVYMPISGGAEVRDAAGSHPLMPGEVYLISGYKLEWQECAREMEVCWVHFHPASFYLRWALLRLPAVHSWPVRKVAWAPPVLNRLPELFDAPERVDHIHPLPDPPVPLVCKVEAVLMWLVADLLEAHPKKLAEPSAALERLRPAIDHMDAHFVSNPTLETLAALTGLAPNYFHRIFQRTVGQTPFQYMEARRMARALQLLTNRRLTLKQVAASCGYCDALYFSRVFHRHFGTRPATFRAPSAP
ncbi:MAG: helix-turn-helix transcriptional regulator [Verrucomicrobia bacterium]|nr:helix-turn-helix transcriptional regulator [Verrucomicrobiota bacterium]